MLVEVEVELEEIIAARDVAPRRAEGLRLVGRDEEAGLTVTPYTFRSSNKGRFPNVREEMEILSLHAQS